jgi:hypothetical protein
MVTGIASERNCTNAGGVRNELDYNNRMGFAQRSASLILFNSLRSVIVFGDPAVSHRRGPSRPHLDKNCHYLISSTASSEPGMR